MNHITNEMNYLVTAVYRITRKKNAWISKELASDSCNQLIYAKTIDFEESLSNSMLFGLIEKSKNRIKLTNTGKLFASMNPGNRYEINRSQIGLLSSVLHRTEFGKRLGEALSAEKPWPPGSHRVLKEIELTGSEVGAKLEPRFAKKVMSASFGGISEEELEEQLSEKREYGGKAEEHVLEFEKKRLVENGLVEESKLTRRVGNLDVTKGYDIESFTRAGPKPNRFIEVKCTKTPYLRFYWSAREVEVARRLGREYYIYFVWLDDNGVPKDIEIINDPTKTVFENPAKYEVSTGTFVVRER